MTWFLSLLVFVLFPNSPRPRPWSRLRALSQSLRRRAGR